MGETVYSIEDVSGPERDDLYKLLLLVPPKQRQDLQLRRLLLFRLRIDGFDRCRTYLVNRTRSADRCGFTGRIFDYLKDDDIEGSCPLDE
ncbi:hypothetical protein D3OALGA1CA_2765 [Olavius algarvensis associated proteobacterium Delta 3]|nr:hypothetical protein D3OALGA1CA_2765 [Olavius algarvensis associated proteobacterium Delta 3]